MNGFLHLFKDYENQKSDVAKCIKITEEEGSYRFLFLGTEEVED